MRILIAARDFKPLSGGIAEYTHQLAQQLHEAGDAVTVLAQSRPGAPGFDHICPYEIRRCNFAKWGERGPLALGRRLFLLRDVAARVHPEIVISNALGREAQACRLFCRQIQLPYVLFTYGREITGLALSPNGSRYRRVMEGVLYDAAAVVTISSYTQNQLEELGVEPAKIHMVRPGINATRPPHALSLDRLSLPAQWCDPSTPVVLTIARLVERKGIDRVLSVMPDLLLEFPNLLYIVGGDGPQASALAASVEANGLSDHVRLVGSVSEAEKGALLQRADLFVMPNRRLADGDIEGFGIVFLEANLYGKAVIGGRSGGAADAIEHGQSGLLVDPDDRQALLDAISTLLKRPDLRHRLGREGARRAREEFSWAVGGTRLRQGLHSLVNTNL